MAEVDLIRRDPNGLNTTIQTPFDDVLGEPDGTHSIDCIWVNSHTCFDGGKNCCYQFLTTLCGLCIALYWGCEFAMITFNMVWCWTPSLKVHQIVCGIAQRFFGVCVQCCLAPVCETCGLCFSNISIKKT